MHGDVVRPADFEAFTLDLSRGCLRRGQSEIKLRPKSFEVLRYLIENQGRLISKDELIQAVWADAFVTDNSLVQCLIEIRRGFGDESQTIIRTLPRRGYIFDLPGLAIIRLESGLRDAQQSRTSGSAVLKDDGAGAVLGDTGASIPKKMYPATRSSNWTRPSRLIACSLTVGAVAGLAIYLSLGRIRERLFGAEMP